MRRLIIITMYMIPHPIFDVLLAAYLFVWLFIAVARWGATLPFVADDYRF